VLSSEGSAQSGKLVEGSSSSSSNADQPRRPAIFPPSMNIAIARD
jgi:hypothetical protein